MPSAFLVKTVAKGSAAWDMGLLGGDRIATIGDQQIPVGGDIVLDVDGIAIGPDGNIGKVRDRLASQPPATPFKMKVLRAGKVIELTGKTQ
jgi:S1-C subfamily serine protease